MVYKIHNKKPADRVACDNKPINSKIYLRSYLNNNTKKLNSVLDYDFVNFMALIHNVRVAVIWGMLIVNADYD